MTEIHTANTEWSILAAVGDSLRGAASDGRPVFAAVTVTSSAAQAAQCQLAGPHPKAIVRFDGSSERETAAGGRGCVVSMEILLAFKGIGSGVDEASRIEESLRLLNAAKNAVEASPPVAASAWGDEAEWRNRLQWGRPSIDAAERPPWTMARLPLEAAFTLDSSVSH